MDFGGEVRILVEKLDEHLKFYEILEKNLDEIIEVIPLPEKNMIKHGEYFNVYLGNYGNM